MFFDEHWHMYNPSYGIHMSKSQNPGTPRYPKIAGIAGCQDSPSMEVHRLRPTPNHIPIVIILLSTLCYHNYDDILLSRSMMGSLMGLSKVGHVTLIILFPTLIIISRYCYRYCYRYSYYIPGR